LSRGSWEFSEFWKFVSEFWALLTWGKKAEWWLELRDFGGLFILVKNNTIKKELFFNPSLFLIFLVWDSMKFPCSLTSP
jgi:hypothetical protein